ncbi:unnamed protein product [Urochloa decumbens]|uniref:Uncharacterized protein n=1 Tax=Urochloa decumbens TaxID=240449 RepID=A0ABC8Z505_9POAL
MDPSRPPLGRGSFLSSSVHAATALLLLLVLLATLLGLPISISPPLGRGSFLSSSVHAATVLLLLLVLLATLLGLPISISPRAAAPATLADQRPQEPQQQACDPASPLDYADPRLFHLMMRRAIDAFPAVHFARPVPGDPPSSSCDMAWRARSDSDDPSKATTKDYRRFAVARDPRTCAYSVLSIGEYHSGPNARKPRRAATNATIAPPPPPALSRSQFARGSYLAYLSGGDRCKPMPHYLRSLLCALAEARYLNRTLVLDLTLCLVASYAAAGTGGMPEEGKRLALYVDVDHLNSQVPIIEQSQFWADWDRRRVEEGLDAGRQVYVAGEGVNSALVEALKAKLTVHHLNEFEDLWRTDSKWFLEMRAQWRGSCGV